MKLNTSLILSSLLSFSALARCQTRTTTNTIDYCQTSYQTSRTTPVPTVFNTATAYTSKTTTFTTSVCTLTTPILPIKKVTATVVTSTTRTTTLPTQTRTSTVTKTAVQLTVSITASATITIGVPKAKRAVLEHPHGAPAVERRAAAYPKQVNCVREIYIQTYTTVTSCKSTKFVGTSSTFTTTTTVTATFTATSTPVTTVTTTSTVNFIPTTRIVTITVIKTSSASTTSTTSSSSSSSSSTSTSTSTTTSSPSTTSSASGVCQTPPTVVDTRSCNPITARYDDDENDVHSTTVFNQFYAGAGFTEDLCNPSTDADTGPCAYWPNGQNYDCTLTACEALQRCVDDAVAFDYYSVDLHFRQSTKMWNCVYFRYDKEYSAGSSAADFNQPDADVVVAYGYQY